MIFKILAIRGNLSRFFFIFFVFQNSFMVFVVKLWRNSIETSSFATILPLPPLPSHSSIIISRNKFNSLNDFSQLWLSFPEKIKNFYRTKWWRKIIRCTTFGRRGDKTESVQRSAIKPKVCLSQCRL